MEAHLHGLRKERCHWLEKAGFLPIPFPEDPLKPHEHKRQKRIGAGKDRPNIFEGFEAVPTTERSIPFLGPFRTS